MLNQILYFEKLFIFSKIKYTNNNSENKYIKLISMKSCLFKTINELITNVINI